MVMSESIKTISGALLKAQSAMGNASKGASNPFYKSKYADLNAVREASLPHLNGNGISVLQPIIQKDGKSFVRTLLLHESGEFYGSDTEIVVAKQNDPQAYGSAISYARRYGLQALVMLGAEDDDGNKAMGFKANQTKETTVTTTIPAETEVKKSSFRKAKITEVVPTQERDHTLTSEVVESTGWEN